MIPRRGTGLARLPRSRAAGADGRACAGEFVRHVPRGGREARGGPRARTRGDRLRRLPRRRSSAVREGRRACSLRRLPRQARSRRDGRVVRELPRRRGAHESLRTAHRPAGAVPHLGPRPGAVREARRERRDLQQLPRRARNPRAREQREPGASRARPGDLREVPRRRGADEVARARLHGARRLCRKRARRDAAEEGRCLGAAVRHLPRQPRGDPAGLPQRRRGVRQVPHAREGALPEEPARAAGRVGRLPRLHRVPRQPRHPSGGDRDPREGLRPVPRRRSADARQARPHRPGARFLERAPGQRRSRARRRPRSTASRATRTSSSSTKRAAA